MNIALLIAVAFTVGLARANDNPCEANADNNAYNKFVKKHIVQKQFSRDSADEWKKYLVAKNLCHRPKQSFFESSDQTDVEDICNGHGHPLKGNHAGNLCISDSNLKVYDMKVGDQCKVTGLVESTKKVVLACDKIVNQCRPVHFEKYTNQQPDNNAGACQP